MALETQGYRFEMVEQYATQRGIAWWGNIYHNDQKIGTADNQGSGGQTAIRISDPQQRAAYNAAADRACPRSYEAPSRFAERLADYADGYDDA